MSNICRLYNNFFLIQAFPSYFIYIQNVTLSKSSVTLLTDSSSGVIFSMLVWSLMSWLSLPRFSWREGQRRAQDFPSLWYWELITSSVSYCYHPNNCHAGKEMEENNKSNKKSDNNNSESMIGDICNRICHNLGHMGASVG